MEAAHSGHGFDGLAGDLGADDDAVVLQPFGGANVVDIRPLVAEQLRPGRAAAYHGTQVKDIICQSTLPFGRLPERDDGVGEDAQRCPCFRLDELAIPIC